MTETELNAAIAQAIAEQRAAQQALAEALKAVRAALNRRRAA